MRLNSPNHFNHIVNDSSNVLNTIFWGFKDSVRMYYSNLTYKVIFI